MYWEDEEFLHEQIKLLSGNAPEPRKDEIKRLQAILSEQARGMDRKEKTRTRASRVFQTAACLALAVWGVSLAFPSLSDKAPSRLEQVIAPHESEGPPYMLNNPPLDHESTDSPSPKSGKNTMQMESRTAEVGHEYTKNGSTSTDKAAVPAHSVQTGSEGDAIAKAKMYLEQQIGAEKQYEVVQSLTNPQQNEFVFLREVNGLPFLNEHYIVALDEQNKGKAITANQIQERAWNEQLFPDPTVTIGRTEAEKILVQTLSRYFAEKQAAVYDPDLMGFIDAKSGQLIGIEKKYDELRGKIYDLDSTRKIWTVTTEDEAIQLLASEFGLVVEKTYRRSENDFLDTRSYRWRTGKSSTITLKTVSSTGEVVEMEYVGQPSTGSSDQMDAARATQTAISFLQNYLAAEVTSLQVIEVEHDKFAYRIYFQALPEQKGSASFSTYTVEVHATTGQVIGFQKNSAKKEQPITKQNQPVRDAITAKEYIDNHPLQLVYVWIHGQEAPSLVYVPLERNLLSGYLEEKK
ncbi:hypothetical protein BRE01_01700 [Brevibacillus reuszeri]|uniref:PepSY domain-containing protein n=1 Tax=Brevibacillus reuszeri TaxID=54915 RepID=A0A0K9YSU0_9BACL|nr:hypothetical protein [Brevibacillus reuszeri]KNB71260.1 hypothetical protein ADS79_20845 [Brevibacillus reuszeri]MED1857699.1 hypothetical protein [Brevibacillus reuszeri]GED66468.1 hypothetical protein BRE01_01700 [Brevibacillus reuszeri]